jgi:ribosomal RNA-processing protein 9
MMLMDTLYGHQAGVSGLDCFQKERPVSVGRDRTARAWKLAEETHLILRGGSRASAADCVSVVKEDWFLTGHDDGFLSLWFTGKKKAIRTIRASYEYDPDPSETSKSSPSSPGVSSSISCCDALKSSDLAATGTRDGYLRLWKVSTGSSHDDRGLEALAKIPLHGFLNGVKIGPNGRFCLVATGQEHRLGRWEKVKRAKNRVALVKLKLNDN